MGRSSHHRHRLYRFPAASWNAILCALRHVGPHRCLLRVGLMTSYSLRPNGIAKASPQQRVRQSPQPQRRQLTAWRHPCTGGGSETPEASALLAAAEQARCCRRRPRVHRHLLLHVLSLPGAQIRAQPPQPQRLPPRLCESRCCCVCHQSQVPGRALQRTTWRCAACMGAASSLHIKHIIGGEHGLVVSRRTLSPIFSLIRHACVAALGTASSLARISHLHAVLCRSCAAWRTAAATNAQQTVVTAPALRHADRSHRILCAVIPIIALLPQQSTSGP